MKPIKVQLAQGDVKPSNEVVLGVILEFKKMKFEENFIVCELDDMEAISSNTFLDTYQVGILRSSSKLKIITRLVDKSSS
jgi:hypothetical protein